MTANGRARPCSCLARRKVLRGIEKHKEPVPCHTNPHHPLLEPISKSAEEDNEASELYEAEEVLGVVFPTDEDAALPLNPSKEALHEPASHIAAQPSPILRGRLASVAAMRRDHLDAVLAQLLIEWIAIVGAIANQILRLGLDHVE